MVRNEWFHFRDCHPTIRAWNISLIWVIWVHYFIQRILWEDSSTTWSFENIDNFWKKVVRLSCLIEILCTPWVNYFHFQKKKLLLSPTWVRFTGNSTRSGVSFHMGYLVTISSPNEANHSNGDHSNSSKLMRRISTGWMELKSSLSMDISEKICEWLLHSFVPLISRILWKLLAISLEKNENSSMSMRKGGYMPDHTTLVDRV